MVKLLLLIVIKNNNNNNRKMHLSISNESDQSRRQRV